MKSRILYNRDKTKFTLQVKRCWWHLFYSDVYHITTNKGRRFCIGESHRNHTGTMTEDTFERRLYTINPNIPHEGTLKDVPITVLADHIEHTKVYFKEIWSR